MQMITFLDVRTMLVVMGATILISGISMMCYAINRKIYGGFGLWTTGLLSGATGFFLISFRHILSDIITIILANALVYLSVILIYLGFAAMAEKKINFRFHLSIMAALSFAVNPFFTYVIADPPARICLISFTAAVYFILDARMVMFQIKDSHFRQNVLLCITLILLAALSGFRGVYYLLPQHAITDYMINVPAQGIFLLLITLLHISFVMGLMQLNAQILERELLQEQARLKKSEEKYRQLVEASRQGLIIARDNPIEFTFISTPMETITGYSPSELKQLSQQQMVKLIHPDDQAQFLHNFKGRLAAQDLPSIQQYRIIHKTMGTRWVETYTSRIEYESHPALHAHFLDITPRKQAEAINTALFTIANAVNTTPDLNALYRTIHTALGTIIDVTNFFIALVNIKAKTLYFPYFEDEQDKDFPPIRDFSINQSLTGMVVSRKAPVFLDESTLKKRSAEKEIQGTAPLIWMGVPLISREKIIGVVAVQSYTNPNLYTEKDVEILLAISHQIAIAIERKQAENALQKSEKKYRHLFTTAPAGIYEIDFEKMKIINVNDIMCRYSEYTEKEILTMNPSDLLDKDGQKNFAERIKSLKAGHKIPKTAEFNIVKKNGEALPVLLSSDLIHEENHLKGAVVVVHDITERKKMEQEKIQAHKVASEQKKLALIGQVAGKMAHDFNNILGIIMGNIELMLLDCENSAMTKTLELILNQTMRGKSMTRNLVAFARTQEPRQSYFNIAGKIDVVLALMKKDLEGIQVIKKYQSRMPDLLADPDMVEHALVNLLQNAVHALGRTKKPMITLSTQHLEDTIYIKIMDNGCGIPQEHLEKIYDPAFTLKGGNDTSGAYPSHVKGTGYGMGNVQKYVHQHKGSVQVTSSINAGTTVTITFPVIEKPLTSWKKKETLKPPIHNGRHILLVEDEQNIFHVQYRILTQSPFHHRVDVAHSGQTAMELFDNNSYDLVSLDYMLPGEYNGMAVYHHIRQQNSNIPVLFISGNIEFLESIKTLKDQDHRLEHLSKPCKNKAYVEGINALLDKNYGHVHGS